MIPSSATIAALLREIRNGLTPKQAAKKIAARWADIQSLAASDSKIADAIAAAEFAALSPARQAWADAAATAPEPKPAQAQPETRLTAITREAAAIAPLPFGFVLWVDQKCVAAGFPPLSPWWRWMLSQFFASGKQWCIPMVGRGGGKSSTLVRVAIAISYFLERVVPPGQTWVFPFLSVSTRESAQRIRDGVAILRAIGEPVIGDTDAGEKVKEGAKVSFAQPPHIDLLDVRGNPISIASLAGSIGNVSGINSVGCMIDEAAKMFDKPENAHPLVELIVSVIQTTRARPNIYCICCSSAWSLDGTHYAIIKGGDNARNFIPRIGASFIEHARAGFADVAAWEDQHGNHDAAKRIRDHLAILTADSPMIPTWTAHPSLGADKYPGTSAALATRLEVEGLSDDMCEGMTRAEFWLRECGSVPNERGGGIDQSRACFIAADIGARLNGRAARVTDGPQKIPGAAIGDPRGPDLRERQKASDWRKRPLL